MLINHDESINPRIIRLALVPVIITILNEKRLCRFDFSSANANKKPPKKRKMYLSPYGAHAASMEDTPTKGKSKTGNKAVTAMGTDSKSHQASINTKMEMRLITSGAQLNGFITASKMEKITGTICLMVYG
jgi:hypothetical protein